ncbi:MAG: hemolysin family protein [Anaerovoracaceae bacterium]|jgi:CBS domain containing-hemolysin-like protein
MEPHIPGQLIAIVCLVLLSAYFSATETAFTSVNRIRLKNMAASGNRKAKLVIRLIEDYDRLLSTVLVGNNIVNIAMTAIATLMFVTLYGEYGAPIATLVVTIIVLIFGEISPKSMAKEIPEKFAMASAPVIQFLVVALRPLTWFFGLFRSLVNTLFKVKNDMSITEDELLIMVEEAETEGAIGNEQSELITNAIEFYELEAYDVLTPRVDVIAIEEDTPKDEIGRLFLETGFSRLPVYEENLDHIVGVLNQKDFHNYLIKGKKKVSEYIKPVVFVSGSIKIAALLKKMQKIKTHIAVVVDEYGGTEGIITMEDIIEELVGEIYDEHDEVIDVEIKPLADGSYVVQGHTNLEKFLDVFNVELETPVTTVNGWVCTQLNDLPGVNDYFESQIANQLFKVTVTKADQRKALEIVVFVEEVPDEEMDE